MFNFRNALDEDKLEAILAWSDSDHKPRRNSKQRTMVRSDPSNAAGFELDFPAAWRDERLETHGGGPPESD